MFTDLRKLQKEILQRMTLLTTITTKCVLLPAACLLQLPAQFARWSLQGFVKLADLLLLRCVLRRQEELFDGLEVEVKELVSVSMSIQPLSAALT